MSRATTVARFAAGVAGRRIRARSGLLFYYGLATTTMRVARRVAGRRSERLLITNLKPGEGLQIRALRRGE